MNLKTLLAQAYGKIFPLRLTPPAQPMILVLIPMVGRARATNWPRACAVLAETLRSLQAMRYGRFQVILAGQDRPDGFPQDDPRFHFLKVPEFRSGRMSDQNEKAKAMVAHAAKLHRGFAYVTYLDADDLLHPDLFGHIARDNNGQGYIVEEGYIIDAGSGRLGRLGRAPGQVPFHRMCGSAGYFAVDFARQPLARLYLRLIGKGHMNYVERTRRMGVQLAPLPFPAVLYLVNHGENVQIRKGHGNDKLAYLEAHEVTDPAEQAAIYAQFGIEKRQEAALGGLLQIRR